MSTEEYYSDEEETSCESSSEEELKEKKVKELKKLPKYERDDIRNIIFEKINDKYSWGRYGDFDVIIMNRNGYINVTKLCSKAKNKKGKPKNFYDWLKNNESFETIEAVSASQRIIGDELLKEITGGSKDLTIIRGTYAHPDLVPHIASWASKIFAVRVSKIVNKFLANQEYEENKRLLKEKDDIINDLHNKMDKVISNNEKLLSDNKKLFHDNEVLLAKADEMGRNVKEVLKVNYDIKRSNVEIKDTLNRVANRGVPPPKHDNDNETLVLIRNNIDTDDDGYQYSVKRVRVGGLKTAINGHSKNYPDSEVILEIPMTPNSRNLWARVRNDLSKKEKIVGSGNNFDLSDNYSENRLIKALRDSHSKRFDGKVY